MKPVLEIFASGLTEILLIYFLCIFEELLPFLQIWIKQWFTTKSCILKFDAILAVAGPGFPVGRIWQNVWRKLHENDKNGLRRGGLHYWLGMKNKVWKLKDIPIYVGNFSKNQWFRDPSQFEMLPLATIGTEFIWQGCRQHPMCM